MEFNGITAEAFVDWQEFDWLIYHVGGQCPPFL